MLKLLYVCSGIGSGPVSKARAFQHYIEKHRLPIELEVACVATYAHLLPAARTHIIRDNSDVEGIKQAVATFQPAAILSCYLVNQIEAATTKLPLYLLWRKFKNITHAHMDLPRWQNIFTIEPTASEDFTSEWQDKVLDSGPIHTIERADLAAPLQARKFLFDYAEKFDNGQPLMLAVHNGLDGNEVQLIINRALRLSQKQYQVLPFSQSTHSNALNLTEPIMKYVLGIDALVAAPGQTLFWEWHFYKKLEAISHFIPVPRQYDPQVWRSSLDKNTILWYNRSNGIKIILDKILTDTLCEK